MHYGEKTIDFDIPAENLCFNLCRNRMDLPSDQSAEIVRALENPTGTGRLQNIVPRNSSVVIMADDRTRMTPQKLILPFVLEELNRAGVSDSNIRVVIAQGTHRNMTSREIVERFGEEVTGRVAIRNHDCSRDLVDMGVTGRGTRILVNREVMDADFRIAVGGVLPHHPAGWSGGAKMLLPGVAGRETVIAMHLLGATESQLGRIDSPCREEMEDFARKVGLHFIFNVILDENGRIVRAAAGHFIDAHREIVSWARKVNGVAFREKADITISSSYPFDYDLTQADKGLFSAALATKTGGEILLLSPCYEGIAPTHGQEMSRLARYDDATLWKMLEENVIENRFAACECMYLNYIRRNFKTTLTMDPLLANLMNFYYLPAAEVPAYVSRKLELHKGLRIGIVNNSGEILPLPEVHQGGAVSS